MRHRDIEVPCLPSDTLSYIYLMVAITSLGYTAFPLSPRNSPIVTSHLLERQNVVQLYVTSDSAMQTLAHEANKLLSDKGKGVALLPMVRFAELSALKVSSILETGIVEIADTDVTVILHSSGKRQDGALDGLWRCPHGV